MQLRHTDNVVFVCAVTPFGVIAHVFILIKHAVGRVLWDVLGLIVELTHRCSPKINRGSFVTADVMDRYIGPKVALIGAFVCFKTVANIARCFTKRD